MATNKAAFHLKDDWCLQALYKEDFEKNKGKGFSVVVDTPEMQRLKKTQDQISNVSAVFTLTPDFLIHKHIVKPNTTQYGRFRKQS